MKTLMKVMSVILASSLCAASYSSTSLASDNKSSLKEVFAEYGDTTYLDEVMTDNDKDNVKVLEEKLSNKDSYSYAADDVNTVKDLAEDTLKSSMIKAYDLDTSKADEYQLKYINVKNILNGEEYYSLQLGEKVGDNVYLAYEVKITSDNAYFELMNNLNKLSSDLSKTDDKKIYKMLNDSLLIVKNIVLNNNELSSEKKSENDNIDKIKSLLKNK